MHKHCEQPEAYPTVCHMANNRIDSHTLNIHDTMYVISDDRNLVLMCWNISFSLCVYAPMCVCGKGQR